MFKAVDCCVAIQDHALDYYYYYGGGGDIQICKFSDCFLLITFDNYKYFFVDCFHSAAIACLQCVPYNGGYKCCCNSEAAYYG